MSARPKTVKELASRFDEKWGSNGVQWKTEPPVVRAKHALDVGIEWLQHRDEGKGLMFIDFARRQLESVLKRAADVGTPAPRP